MPTTSEAVGALQIDFLSSLYTTLLRTEVLQVTFSVANVTRAVF